MISLSHWSKIHASAKAWTGTLPAVHINLRNADEEFSLGLGYLSISPDNARVLAHQLMVAAETLEAEPQRAAA